MPRPLSRAWFERAAPLVAPELLGRLLARRRPDGTILRARIVEVEAYEPHDPASHSFRGPSSRNAVMFGPPAHLYVYLIYGMHHCMNVVTGPVGYGSAVLLRAAELLAPHPNAAERVPVVDRRGAGPALLAKALGVTRQLDGADLLDRSGQIWLEAGRSLDAAQVTVTRRVGVSNGSETPWRWVETGSPFASGGASPLKARGGSRP